jgi:hypothetical protein
MAAGAAMANRNKNNADDAGQDVGGDDVTAQLQELKNLKDQGIITQEEFDAKKKQILGL